MISKLVRASVSAVLLSCLCVELVEARTINFLHGTENPDYEPYSGDDGRCVYCFGDGFNADGFNYMVDPWWGQDIGYHEGLTLDDDGIFGTFVFREDGIQFSLNSITLRDAGDGIQEGTTNSIFRSGAGPAPSNDQDESAFEDWSKEGGAFDGLLYGLYGYRGDTVVASYEFGASQPTGRISLPDGFSYLDAIYFDLPFKVDHPGIDTGPPLTSNTLWCEWDTCTHFEVTKMNVTLATPIPLPAALPLLAAGLGSLGLIGALRRRRAPQLSS